MFNKNWGIINNFPSISNLEWKALNTFNSFIHGLYELITYLEKDNYQFIMRAQSLTAV